MNTNIDIDFSTENIQNGARSKYTRAAITKADGSLDTFIIEALLKKGVRIQDLPLVVAYYARVSTDEEDQIHSLQSQVKWYDDMINNNENWTMYKGYFDEGITGTSVKKREQFLDMINDAQQHKFDLIVTKEISRFARNTIDSLEYTRKLLHMGIGVWFESDGVLTFEADSEFRLTIMSSVAQEESRKTHERVKRGNRMSIKNGVVLGNNRIYGYTKYQGKLTINEEEAVIVKEIFDLYANKFYGLRKIARILYDKGYRNFDGKRIAETTIKRIIQNPKYKGYYCGGKTTKYRHLDTTVKKIPKEEWVMYKDETGETVPAIVSEELWEKANAIMNKKVAVYDEQVKKPCFNGGYPYSGKIICEEHGTAYCRSVYRNKRKDGTVTEREVWQCATYIKQGAKACDKPVLYTDELDDIVYGIVEALIRDKDALFKKIDSICIEAAKNPGNVRLKESILADIQKLNSRRDKLLDLLLAGRITDEEFDERNKSINQQMEEKKIKIIEIEEQDKIAADMISKAEELKGAIAEAMQFRDGFNRGIVDSIIEQIVVKRESTKKNVYLDIYLRCQKSPIPYSFEKGKCYTSIRSQCGPSLTTNRSEDEECYTSIRSPKGGWWWC